MKEEWEKEDYVARVTAICRNPPIRSFTRHRKKVDRFSVDKHLSFFLRKCKDKQLFVDTIL